MDQVFVTDWSQFAFKNRFAIFAASAAAIQLPDRTAAAARELRHFLQM
ncbi:hypothetical protein LJC08_06210 [Methanimicrococcus sp. OttesenSCG-928-J09]|nr:hypothetical protein [Methanimicrococcus sp. OttesenSCG-928-J09]